MDESFRTGRGTVGFRSEQPADAAFLYTLFSSHALAALACDGGGRDALIRMQFEAQTAGYRSQFPAARFAIVLLDDAPVGRLILDETIDAACIVDLALLPDVQGDGLGTAILRNVLAGLADRPMTVRCRVLFSNTASLRMCHRAGFMLLCDEPPFLQLEWHSPAHETHCHA